MLQNKEIDKKKERRKKWTNLYKNDFQNFCIKEYGEWIRVNLQNLNTLYVWVHMLRNIINGSFPQN